jgi:phosphatidylglycerophosphatase A
VGLLLFWPLAAASPLVQLSAAVALYFVGVAASTIVARELRRGDPGLVVVDEIVGMWVSLVALPLTPATVGVAFLLFRVFDVVKPYPARELEDLPGGWGIMSDDVAAGVYANAAVRALLLAFPA